MTNVIAFTIRLPEEKLRQLSDVGEHIRREQNLVAHPTRQDLVSLAVELLIRENNLKSKTLPLLNEITKREV